LKTKGEIQKNGTTTGGHFISKLKIPKIPPDPHQNLDKG